MMKAVLSGQTRIEIPWLNRGSSNLSGKHRQGVVISSLTIAASALGCRLFVCCSALQVNVCSDWAQVLNMSCWTKNFNRTFFICM